MQHTPCTQFFQVREPFPKHMNPYAKIRESLSETHKYRALNRRSLSISMISMAMVVFVTCLKLLGTDVLVKFNTILLIFSMLPAFVFMFGGIKELEADVWSITDNVEINWSLFVSWLLWLYSGFFSLGI